jgi:hypothetical protein
LKSIFKGLLRLVAMVLWVAFGFCWGFFAGAKYCEWWVVPRWVKEYPHDGQLGLGVLAYALVGGFCVPLSRFSSGSRWSSGIGKGRMKGWPPRTVWMRERTRSKLARTGRFQLSARGCKSFCVNDLFNSVQQGEGRSDGFGQGTDRQASWGVQGS